MRQATIRTLLDTQLQTITLGGTVVVEGMVYANRRDTPYLKSYISSYDMRATAIGAASPNEANGTYTVMVVRPAMEGAIPARAIAASVVTVFPQGSLGTTSDGVQVSILFVSEGPATNSGDWTHVPVTVGFYAVG